MIKFVCLLKKAAFSGMLSLCSIGIALAAENMSERPVPREHPRLLGSIERLRELARERPEAYSRMADVARNKPADDHQKMISMALVSAIEGDNELGRKAVELAMKYVNSPIRVGHETFGHDLARCAIVYDLCFPCWTEEERQKFHEYMNKTVDANINSETHVFHNAWYGYKHWGYGLAGYATYYENPRAPEILAVTEEDYRKRAAPALELAGNGGGWAEGYYINYWSYEWLFFCEVARLCEGADYYSLAPNFYKYRAIVSMFEAYPGIGDHNTRRPIPMGDGGGRIYGGDRDKALSARRILVNLYREDPAHQVVNTFNETTPVSGSGINAYKDFLWRDTTVVKGDLKKYKLSHFSPGAGYVYARSSWDEDATYFFFKCGDRFTAHQHLDNGHFLIYKYQELAGDGGHYDGFGTNHDVNYHLRTIAHSTILVKDPDETWPAIRAWKGPIGNDGGQRHDWPHHNGAAIDPEEWQKNRNLYDIADITAFEDRGSYLYVAGDCSRSYRPNKVEYFTRQIVFIRPNTFVIFDRVKSTDPGFQKTWLLQAMKTPTGEAPYFKITNGRGRLIVQTLLPRKARINFCSGDKLYSYDRKSYPPERDTGLAPECRIEISPQENSAADYFLNVLTATESAMNIVPQAKVRESGSEIQVKVGEIKINFIKQRDGGVIEYPGQRAALAREIVPN